MANELNTMVLGVRDYVADCIFTSLGLTAVKGAPRMVLTAPYARVSCKRGELSVSTPVTKLSAHEVVVGLCYDIPADTDSEEFLLGKLELARAEIDSDPHADNNANLCTVTSWEITPPEENHGDTGYIEFTVAATSDIER